jgi:DNA-binding MarR family transcriptional regulator
MASLIERLRRQFLHVVKHELENAGIRDINNVQASMFFNISDAETSAGELTTRGCYLGSNVTYNLKRLVEEGYLTQQRSPDDRRLTLVSLTAKGRAFARPTERDVSHAIPHATACHDYRTRA